MQKSNSCEPPGSLFQKVFATKALNTLNRANGCNPRKWTCLPWKVAKDETTSHTREHGETFLYNLSLPAKQARGSKQFIYLSLSTPTTSRWDSVHLGWVPSCRGGDRTKRRAEARPLSLFRLLELVWACLVSPKTIPLKIPRRTWIGSSLTRKDGEALLTRKWPLPTRKAL